MPATKSNLRLESANDEARSLKRAEHRFMVYRERDRRMREARWVDYGRTRFLFEMTVRDLLQMLRFHRKHH